MHPYSALVAVRLLRLHNRAQDFRGKLYSTLIESQGFGVTALSSDPHCGFGLDTRRTQASIDVFLGKFVHQLNDFRSCLYSLEIRGNVSNDRIKGVLHRSGSAGGSPDLSLGRWRIRLVARFGGL